MITTATTTATTTVDALAYAEARGWATGTGMGDLCPGHSGRTTSPPPVRRIRPRTEETR
ncbi:hypothetical protein [Streptomyces sp. NPDC048057]|uniref:hypothetical protein n=1 Tax=Streptomyces sp. NPDC048057 TaxID=3155628 RepID=UPI003411414B